MAAGAHTRSKDRAKSLRLLPAAPWQSGYDGLAMRRDGTARARWILALAFVSAHCSFNDGHNEGRENAAGGTGGDGAGGTAASAAGGLTGTGGNGAGGALGADASDVDIITDAPDDALDASDDASDAPSDGSEDGDAAAD